MFTGIIKAKGEISASVARGGDRRLTIRAPGLPWSDYAQGDSISVNGVCLTAVALHEDGFDTDVSRETLSVTTLASLAPGARVNLEPALAVGERLGGHLVSGHVDGIGTVRSRRDDGRAVRLEFSVPPDIAKYIARKGSVAIDGVSLTINEVSGNDFGVSIIPHTLHETIIGDYRPGTAVNVEVDMMARYLERLLDETRGDDGATGLSRQILEAHGYG